MVEFNVAGSHIHCLPFQKIGGEIKILCFSGASGEYAGLLAIRKYLQSVGQGQRNVIFFIFLLQFKSNYSIFNTLITRTPFYLSATKGQPL